jgi:hypothetical protein
VIKEVERRMSLNESYMRVLSVLHIPPELTRAQVDGEALAAVGGDDRDD